MKNIMDPGHGGKDSGAVGKLHKEKDLTLEVCLKLEKQFKCELTRNSDKYVTLSTRGCMAKDANLFASVHFDAFNNTASGCTVFYSVDIPEDEKHAEKIANELSKALGIKNRGAKTRESTKYKNEDYYTVIDKAQDNGCKHVFLIECGFISNPIEEKKMNTSVIANTLNKCFREISGLSNIEKVDDKLLKLKSKGEEVKKLQRLINKIYNLKLVIDGSFGPKTLEVVEFVQKDLKVAVDGIVGEKTMAALNAKLKSIEFNKHELVKALQTLLKQLNYNGVNGKALTLDGLKGKNTDHALVKFIKDIK